MNGENPVVKEGDRIKIDWSSDEDSSGMFTATITSIEKCKKEKNGSFFKYTLLFEDGAERTTRLLHKSFTILKKGKKRKLDSSVSLTKLPIHKYILAPMVGGSELAFRLLCRKYGAQLAYTPMMSSEKFAVDAEYRKTEFQTTAADRPLVAHFSANNPTTLVIAAKFVENQCDAIDINLGCPQRIAHSGHFGSYLLGSEDRKLVLDMVKTASTRLSVPLFVKIRLLDTLEETIELCRQLSESGAALIAIHARYRVNLVGRTGAGARDGAAMLDQVREVKKALPGVVIIANGNVKSFDDVKQNLEFTAADGIMSAEGLLDNPALFLPSLTGVTKGDGKTPNGVELAKEYLGFVEQYPVKLKSVVFHVRRMCKEYLEKFQLLEDCIQAKTVEDVKSIVEKAWVFETKGGFTYDEQKQKKMLEALKRKKHEEGKRKAYEDRMRRKAKREGLKDLDHYLNIGSQCPTEEELNHLKTLPKDQAFSIWKSNHSQHCFAFHLEEKGCSRDRTCSFLHADRATIGGVGEQYG